MSAREQPPGAVVRLRDGRALGYLELGDPEGPAVVMCHGSPGSRLDALMVDPAALQRLPARVIVPDRPGLGLSDFQRGRTFLDHAADVRELADRLGIDRFAVMGVSGGGPYAAACAVALPERVSGVAIVSGLCPLRGNTAGMGSNRHFFRLARGAPWLVRAMMAPLGRMLESDPQRAAERVFAGFAGPDRELLRASRRLEQAFLASLQEAFRQGARGVVEDMALYARPWGFDPGAIRVPVHVWQGEADTNVPPAMGRYWERTVAGAVGHFFPGEGHLMFVRRMPEIFEALLGERVLAGAGS